MSVFVSGATGFIAQHIVGQLLDQNYKVIGTARSQEKIDNLQSKFGNNPNFTMEIVEDIAVPNAFDEAIKKHAKDIKVVLHTASPFHFNTNEVEKDLLIPAVNGTKGILESIKKYAADSVEKVVITSSFAAMLDISKGSDSSVIFTEEDWNPDTWESCQSNAVAAYCGSKKFAEDAAWEFLKENKDKVKFTLNTVNPVYVFGPQKFDSDVSERLNTSCELVNQFVHAKPETNVAGVSGQFIDVRDVAKAHLLAFQRDDIKGQRLLLANGNFSAQDIIDQLNEDFDVLRGKIPVGEPQSGAQHKPITCSINNDKTKKALGFEFISFKKTIHDTAEQILKHDGVL